MSDATNSAGGNTGGPPGTLMEHTIQYPYTRTTGPVLGAFLTALRDGRLLGGRINGVVHCPPLEYDPATGESADLDPVDVGPGGTVVLSTWVDDTTPKHPFAEPFAFALVLLDGADVPILHAVRASGPEAVAAGQRVVARWRSERAGSITDIYFVPADGDAPQLVEGDDSLAADEVTAADGTVDIMIHDISLTMREALYPHRQRYADALLAGRILGQRSPASGKVYVPGKGYDPMERVLMDESCDVELPAVGTVVGFTQLTPIQYHGQTETKPWIRCSILLDGADQPVVGIDIRDIEVADFRVGMRLQGVWRPEGERDISELDNRSGSLPEGVFERWEPTGEPDVDPDSVSGMAW